MFQSVTITFWLILYQIRQKLACHLVHPHCGAEGGSDPIEQEGPACPRCVSNNQTDAQRLGTDARRPRRSAPRGNRLSLVSTFSLFFHGFFPRAF